ncbi:MAG: glycosyltransferase, partial [Propionicimonas sp.]|nr:glycosyltransferase [Propionicimonas sp.]
MPRLLVFPRWRSNPYLNMLYVGARAEGWTVRGSRKVDELAGALASLEAGDVFHVHWTHPICQSKTTEAAARRALDSFRATVTEAIGRGIRLVWTVHNHLPHSTRYRELELELTAFLAGSAWRIIQLNPHTREAVAEDYDLPGDRLVTLRHASYRGVYPPPPDPLAARARLGVAADAPTLGFVGQIHPYKGILNLLAAADRLADRFPGLTVLLAGRADEAQAAEIAAATPPGVRVVSRLEFVPDEDLGTWFAASDLMVFPYRRVLNSGSLLAAATFARPAVLPAEPHLVAEYGSEPWVSFFDQEDDPTLALAETIAAALPGAGAQRASALEFAAAYTTYDMAWDYLRILAGERPLGTARPVTTPAVTASPELSVVIPTFNIAGYVDELLRSVRSSQDVALEVVVVDDHSTDGTWEAVQRHAAADPRVRATRSPGSGGGQARNAGAELARGEYLAFADGDDIVPPRAYAAMLAAARADGSDLAVGDFVKFTANSTWRSDPEFGYSLPLSGGRLADRPGLIRNRPCWNRVARRDFWLERVLPFASVPRTNDIVTLTSALTGAGRISVVPVVSYIYRIRPGEGSMLSTVGSDESTISYLSEELTCAKLVDQTGDEAVITEYWSMVLAGDTWYHLHPLLTRAAATPDPAVWEHYRKLLELAPPDALATTAPTIQAFHALLLAGRTGPAAALARHLRGGPEFSPREAEGVLAEVAATGGLTSRTQATLRSELLPPAPPAPPATPGGDERQGP